MELAFIISIRTKVFLETPVACPFEAVQWLSVAGPFEGEIRRTKRDVACSMYEQE